MKHYLFILLVFALGTPFISLESHAQRPTSKPATIGCYRQPITPISAIPTLHSDMPLDCILGYIYFDSLCRSFSSWDQSDAMLDSLVPHITSWDTMRSFMRFMYRMQEYDADLYVEFIQSARYLDTSYRLMPGAFELRFIEQMRSVLGYYNKLAYLTIAPVILHIKVIDTTASYDSLCPVPVWPLPRKCVSAIVLDTIKGIHLRSGTTIAFKQVIKRDKPLSMLSWINIAYTPTSAKPSAGGDVSIGQPFDSTGLAPFQCDSCFGWNALIPGNEYIVFLDDGFLDYNGTNSFYEYVPYNGFNSEGGIFPVDSSGNVLSSDNYFGYGPLVPLSTFETDLQADIQSIVSH